ncbi:FecR family protein [Treponema sp. SP13]|uniref:FecR family protein n=1 Tax=Treponema sp. SP13 TaxID=2789742 RepID=UPI003D8C32FE
MKTKKSTKYNPDSPSAASVLQDIAVVVFSLAAVAFTSHLFYRDVNKTLERSDKAPVATVSYKYKSVQRKFLDRSVWDRPVQYSPVYNGDIIRTAPSSEATINFPDQNVISVGANTMIQIFKQTQKDETAVQVDEGKISVQTAGSAMAVRSDNASVNVEKDSVLHMQKLETDREADSSGGVLRLSVEKGRAALSKTGGSSTEADSAAQGEILTEGTVVNAASDAVFAPNVEENRFVSVISPAPEMKILNKNTDGKAAAVPFKWYSSFADNSELIFERSRSRDFTQNVRRVSVTGLKELTVDEGSGTVYWRLYAAEKGPEDASSDSGKFTVLAAPPPALLEPAPDKRYVYKEALPAVRFLWKGNEACSSYVLEAASDPGMKNPAVTKQVSGESISFVLPGDGTWYWRLTPIYAAEDEASRKPTPASVFYIEKQKTFAPIEQLAPGKIADTAEGKSVTFSWKSVSEVKKYLVRVAKTEAMDNPVLERSSDINYYELKNAAKALPNGSYYWTVEGLDKNGERLTSSAAASFKTRDSEVILRSLFPPENYVLADTLCLDTRFTWKTNLEGEQRFQVSSSPDFSSPVLDVKAQGSGIEGLMFERGDCYWRVAVKSEDETFYTPAKKLNVVPALPRPELIGIGDSVVVRPDAKTTFAWTAVPLADYYQVKITEPGLDSVPLYENLYITATEVKMALQSIREGRYVIHVQGFAASTLTSSRRYSYAADKTFDLKHLRPVELVSPPRGAKISGVDAALKPGSLQWSSVEKPVKSRLVLEKIGKAGSLISASNPDYTVNLPPLEAGTYRWRVTATTEDGLDISSVRDGIFTVLPIPPLEKLAVFSPAENQTFGANFFKTNRSIVFRWKKNAEATHYSIKLYNAKNQKIFERNIEANEASAGNKADECTFTFTDLAKLSRGTFYVDIRAQRRLKNGLLFQDGNASVRNFVIDLPQTKKIETDDTGVLYGR